MVSFFDGGWGNSVRLRERRASLPEKRAYLRERRAHLRER